MPRLYIEQAVQKVHDYFSANLNTKLGVIRTENSSTLPVNYLELTKRVSQKRLFPKVTINKDNTSYNYSSDLDSTSLPLLEPWIIYRFVISVEHLHGSLDVLDDTLMRYSEAIERIIADDDTFNKQFIWVQLVETDWTPLVEDQTTKNAHQAVLITIECRVLTN